MNTFNEGVQIEEPIDNLEHAVILLLLSLQHTN